MRNLPALFVAAALVAVNTTANAQAPPGSLWYNGDWDGVNGLDNERNTIVTQAAVYDDFNVIALGWNVTAVFSDNLVIPDYHIITGADWEIRSGVSEGNAGTLVASGTTNSPVITEIECNINNCVSRVEVTGLNVFLPMLPSGQHYWLNVTPVGNGTGRSFNITTSGANCVGSPCGNDDNAFWNSSYFGVYFDHTYNQCEGCNDFSMGVIGTVVPEPSPVALLTCGLGALLIALRRRSRTNSGERTACPPECGRLACTFRRPRRNALAFFLALKEGKSAMTRASSPAREGACAPQSLKSTIAQWDCA